MLSNLLHDLYTILFGLKLNIPLYFKISTTKPISSSAYQFLDDDLLAFPMSLLVEWYVISYMREQVIDIYIA